MGLFKSFNSLVLVSNVLRNEEQLKLCLFVCLFDVFLYVLRTTFQFNRDGTSWVEPELK